MSSHRFTPGPRPGARRLFLLSAAALACVLVTACDPPDETTGPEPSGSSPAAGSSLVPADDAVYDVQISGSTYAGNANFLHNNPQFTPTEQFARSAQLVVTAAVGSGAGDRASREVGIFSGSITGSDAGIVLFATNSRLFERVPSVSRTWANAAMDVAVVTADAARGTVLAELTDGGVGSPITRRVQPNIFIWRTGLASPKQVLAGRISLTFTDGGRSVAGEAQLFGETLAGVPGVGGGTYAIAFRISGRRR